MTSATLSAAARAHIARLRAQNITLAQIAVAAKVGECTVRRVGRGIEIRASRARAILAVTADDCRAVRLRCMHEAEPLTLDFSDVDEVAIERALAGESVELSDVELIVTLQAGVARGIPLSRLSAQIGINHLGAKRMLGGRLTPHREKRARIAAELLRDPHQSTKRVSTRLGMAFETVKKVREHLIEQELIAS